MTPIDVEWAFEIFKTGGAELRLLALAYEAEQTISSVVRVDRLPPAEQALSGAVELESWGWVAWEPAVPSKDLLESRFLPCYQCASAWEGIASHWSPCPECGANEPLPPYAVLVDRSVTPELECQNPGCGRIASLGIWAAPWGLGRPGAPIRSYAQSRGSSGQRKPKKSEWRKVIRGGR